MPGKQDLVCKTESTSAERVPLGGWGALGRGGALGRVGEPLAG